MSSVGDAGWDRRAEVAGVPLFWREAPAPRADTARVLYVHGVPTNSDDFLPFLERTGGLAPDLPGFGRSGKPGDFDYSIAGYSRFLEAFIEQAGIERFSLVVHDWGAVGLALSSETLRRLERLVIMNAVPLLTGYRWHRMARTWRTPLLGELAMGFSSRWGFKRLSRGALAGEGPAPEYLIDRVWDHFDHGTQRAILKLYRSAPSELLAASGERLAEIACPALVLWGADDPYIPLSFAQSYGDALAGPARVEALEDAGHWPWIDRPEVIDAVTGFLAPSEG